MENYNQAELQKQFKKSTEKNISDKDNIRIFKAVLIFGQHLFFVYKFCSYFSEFSRFHRSLKEEILTQYTSIYYPDTLRESFLQ